MTEGLKTMEKPEPIIAKRRGKTSENPAVFKDAYPIQEPYLYAAIIKDPDTKKTTYKIIEPTLQKNEKKLLTEVKKFLIEEIDVNLKEIETKEKAELYLEEKMRETIKNTI